MFLFVYLQTYIGDFSYKMSLKYIVDIYDHQYIFTNKNNNNHMVIHILILFIIGLLAISKMQVLTPVRFIDIQSVLLLQMYGFRKLLWYIFS